VFHFISISYHRSLDFSSYFVDRQKSVDVLQSFLAQKDHKVESEAKWLADIKARCVMSDAAFLAW